jgi:uncharacterized protein YoaH (UPF0181 family)
MHQIYFPLEKGMDMDCWHHEIDRAATEAEVVKSASDYLFLWAPQELAPVTQGWRDLRIENASDVERVKNWLIEGVASTHAIAPHAAALRELASYFWHAAARINELRLSGSHIARPASYPSVPLLH